MKSKAYGMFFGIDLFGEKEKILLQNFFLGQQCIIVIHITFFGYHSDNFIILHSKLLIR